MSSLIKITTAALMLATSVMLARILPAAEFGIYALAAAIAVLVAQPAGFGLSTLAIRIAADAQAKQHDGLLRGYMRFALWTPAVYAAVVLIVAVAIAQFTPWHIDAALVAALAGAVPLVLALPIGEALGALQRAGGAPLAGQMPDQIFRHLVFFILLAAALALVGILGLTPALVLTLQAAGAGLACLVSFIMLRRLLGAAALKAVPRYAVGEWARRLWPLGLVAAAQALSANADLLVVGALMQPADAGIYRVAVQLALLVAFHLSAVAAVAVPRLAAMRARCQVDAMQRLLSQCALGLATTAMGAALVLAVFGESILGHVFGPAFRAGAPALTILAIAQVLNAATGPVGVTLSTLGFERDALRGVLAGAATNIALSLLLVPRFGLVGAALAAAAGLVSLNLTLVALLYSRTGLLSLPLLPGAIARAK